MLNKSKNWDTANLARHYSGHRGLYDPPSLEGTVASAQAALQCLPPAAIASDQMAWFDDNAARLWPKIALLEWSVRG